LVGVSATWAKNLDGLDHDGDASGWWIAPNLLAYGRAIKDLRAGETPKLKKVQAGR